MHVRLHHSLDLVGGTDDLLRVLEQVLAGLVVLNEVFQHPGSSLVLWLIGALRLEVERSIYDQLVPLQGLALVDHTVLDTDISMPLEEEHDIGSHDGMKL